MIQRLVALVTIVTMSIFVDFAFVAYWRRYGRLNNLSFPEHCLFWFCCFFTPSFGVWALYLFILDYYELCFWTFRYTGDFNYLARCSVEFFPQEEYVYLFLGFWILSVYIQKLDFVVCFITFILFLRWCDFNFQHEHTFFRVLKQAFAFNANREFFNIYRESIRVHYGDRGVRSVQLFLVGYFLLFSVYVEF